MRHFISSGDGLVIPISEIQGIESLEAVKKLCAGAPARLGDIVRRII